MRYLATLDKRRVATAIVTFAVAFLCGHFMQKGLAAPVTVADVPVQEKVLPTAPAATRFAGLQPPPVLADRVARSARKPDAPEGCTPALTVVPAPAATLRVELTAPCHPEVRARVTQGEVSVSQATDDTGTLSLRLPALTTDPEIAVSIAGKALTARVEVPDAAAFEHVALQWDGPQVLRINAYEFGARKSQFGHVWAGAPKTPSRASRGSGGFLTRLGDGRGKSAEIYSFPAGQAPARGVIRLVVEAKVTRETCGRDVRATALQSGPLASLRPTEVELAMPGCDKLGEIVGLQNLFQDMRLAGR